MSSRKNLPKKSDGATLTDWTPSQTVSLCALAALTALAYANSLQGKFVFDDLVVVLQEPKLMNVKTIGDVFAVTGGRWLLIITYALNYYWSGVDTFSYHLVNVALHVINVLLVYGIILSVLRDGRRSRYVALCGAAVFGVQTLLSGAVSYIAGRSSVLCGTFYFLAVYLFFNGLNTERRQTRFALFGGAAVAAVLAWGAKQEAITLPLFLAAVVLLQARKINWRWIAALSAIPVLFVMVTWNRLKALYAGIEANRVLVSAGFEKVMPATTYFRTYVATVVDYFFPRFVFPVHLSIDPQIVPVEHWYALEFLVSAAILAASVLFAVVHYKKQPLFALGITATLVSPLMAYAVIPLPDVVQEHRAYIPGLGMAFLFGALFQWFQQKYSRLRWIAPVAVVLLFLVMTVSRNKVFATNIAVWEDAVGKAPQKPRPHFNLGQAYQDAKRLPEAVREYERCLELNPDAYAAYSNLSAIYLDQGQFQKGEEMLLKVTSLSPNFTEGFINLAVLYIRKRDPDKALAAINRALETNPDSYVAHYNKGEVLTMREDYKAAVESYKRAVYLRPDMTAFKLTLGVAYMRVGDLVSAEKQFNELTNSPVAAEAYRNLGLLYNNAGQPDQAMQYFNQAVRVQPAFAEVYHDIGVVYLRKQMPDQAIQQFRTVLQQQPDHGPAVLDLAAAYQMKGDIPAARQVLQTYVQQYGNTALPYVAPAMERLLALQ
jgi:tetratricopeptide (TPR) repeat protein